MSTLEMCEEMDGIDRERNPLPGEMESFPEGMDKFPELRDPLPEELETPEFNAVWDLIKHWDIGLPQDITKNGHQLYAHATGNCVVAILDVLKGVK